MIPAGARTAWLVLPTYEEAENIEPFVASVREYLPSPRRILIVDDASPDGTGGLADGLAERHDDVEVLHRAAKEGLGPAYLAGFRRAMAGGAGLICEMDSDFSHSPEDLPRLVAAAGRADIALGSRYVDGGNAVDWGVVRRILSRGGSAYARAVLGVEVRDLTGGFKCIRREVLEAIDPASLRSRGYAFQIELTYRALRAGFTVEEIPISFRDRSCGTSKMDWPIMVEALWRVPSMRSEAKARSRAADPADPVLEPAQELGR